MRLRSVFLRNYRIHRELKVDLDPSCTLIGGPNESGKSTFVEAIHRALFLRARGNTEYHRAMTSHLHPGQPEVELEFDSGGTHYLLKKKFGSNGVTMLAPSDSSPLSGEQAEAELARILGVEPGATGKAILAQWSHLWIWQGKSGTDPLEDAHTHQDSLLRRLQDSGGAAAMLSATDSAVAKHFADLCSKLFTQAGKPKAGSDWEKAEAFLQHAEHRLHLAQERLSRSLGLVRDFEEATSTLAQLEVALTNLIQEKREADARATRVEELRTRESTQAAAVKTAAEKHEALSKVHEQIQGLRGTLKEAEAALESAKAKSLAESFEQARQQFDAASRNYETASEAVRAARLRRDLVAAAAKRMEEAERLALLEKKEKAAQQHTEAIEKLRKELATLPEIHQAALDRLHQLDRNLGRAEAALNGMAAELEVRSAPEPILAGEETLVSGSSKILTDTTEIRAGDTVLVIRPGGGANLAKARTAAADARNALRDALAHLGVDSAEEAAKVAARRTDLENRIALEQVALKSLQAENLNLAASRDALAAAEAELSRRRSQLPGLSFPETLAEAKALLSEEERKVLDAEAAEERTRKLRDLAEETCRKSEAAVAEQQKVLHEHAARINSLRSQLEILVQNHGDDAERERLLKEHMRILTTAQESLAEIRHALAEQQPDLLAADAARLQAALAKAMDQQKRAETQHAVAQAGLLTDGSDDPQAAVALAQAEVESARNQFAHAKRHARAIQLLHQLFTEEQRTLADRFTQPFAARISGYLECLFGSGTRVHVTLENNKFRGLQLARPGFPAGALDFESLSGGTREQVAAAVRLAMAEVLCEDFHSCLPIVFDDGFTNSDPARVQTLQRMLYKAATRGLQVIVLTCTPTDYAALGATSVQFPALENADSRF